MEFKFKKDTPDLLQRRNIPEIKAKVFEALEKLFNRYRNV